MKLTVIAAAIILLGLVALIVLGTLGIIFHAVTGSYKIPPL